MLYLIAGAVAAYADTSSSSQTIEMTVHRVAINRTNHLNHQFADAMSGNASRPSTLLRGISHR